MCFLFALYGSVLWILGVSEEEEVRGVVILENTFDRFRGWHGEDIGLDRDDSIEHIKQTPKELYFSLWVLTNHQVC